MQGKCSALRMFERVWNCVRVCSISHTETISRYLPLLRLRATRHIRNLHMANFTHATELARVRSKFLARRQRPNQTKVLFTTLTTMYDGRVLGSLGFRHDLD